MGDIALTRSLHFAENVGKEPVHFCRHAEAERVQYLPTTPNFPGLHCKLNHGRVGLVVAVPEQIEHPLTNRVAHDVKIRLLGQIAVLPVEGELLADRGGELHDLRVQILDGLQNL